MSTSRRLGTIAYPSPSGFGTAAALVALMSSQYASDARRRTPKQLALPIDEPSPVVPNVIAIDLGLPDADRRALARAEEKRRRRAEKNLRSKRDP